MAKCALCGSFRKNVCRVDKKYEAEIKTELERKAEERRQVQNAIRRGRVMKKKQEELTPKEKKVVMDHLELKFDEIFEEEEVEVREEVKVE